jgi:death-on-curing protein
MNAMVESRWLTVSQVFMLHAESLRLFGGRPGIRDQSLLESALARPQQLLAYGEDPSLFELAAEYGYGLARNHAFVDGNKRVALLAIRVFLYINGFLFHPDQIETITHMQAIAAGTIDQAYLARWIEANSTSRS